MKKTFLSFIVATLALPASAQNIDKAITAFKKGDYEVAATQFYSVLRFDAEAEGDVAEAQYGLAKSFEKLGLPLAALKYYEDIAKVGSDHPNFAKAVEGLVDVGEALNDDLKTPQVLDALYGGENLNALQKINPEIIQRVHFVLGRFAFNKGNFNEAKDFLNTVKPGNPSYPHAQYMLGLVKLGVGKSGQTAPKYDQVVEHFENARTAIAADAKDEELLGLRDLASLGLARSYYERAYELEDGDPKRTEGLRLAQVEFQRVPRFSNDWAEALFERAWAHTVNNEYGRALGALHSLRAPYFTDEFYPEAKILEAIIYYYNCQWDRVNTILDETKADFEPMAKELEDLVKGNLADDEWYPLLQKSLEQQVGTKADGLLDRRVAHAIARDPKFMKMQGFLKEIDREAKIFEKNAAFAKSDMGREMTDFANDARDAYLSVIGKFLKTKVRDVAGEITDITTRASLVSLETKTAEADWLEQGKEIDASLKRKRLPRPFIPDDTFQFWWFRDEYWVDELGYYEFTIKTECYE